MGVAGLADRKQAALRAALKKYGEVSERAFLVDASCTLEEDAFEFWLVMLAESDGLQVMLESLKKRD